MQSNDEQPVDDDLRENENYLNDEHAQSDLSFRENNDNDQQNDTSSNVDVYTSSNLSGFNKGLDNLELDHDVSDFSEVLDDLESDYDVSERNAEQDYHANPDVDQVNNIYL